MLHCDSRALCTNLLQSLLCSELCNNESQGLHDGTRVHNEGAIQLFPTSLRSMFYRYNGPCSSSVYDFLVIQRMSTVKCILFSVTISFLTSLENYLCNGISLLSDKIGDTLEGPLAGNIVNASAQFDPVTINA